MNFIISDAADRLNLVRHGKAAFAVISTKQVPNEMDSKLLKPDKFILVAPAAWKGRRLTDLLNNERIIDFDESDETTFNYLKQFNLETPKRQRLFVNNNDAIIRMFSKGVGFGTLTQEIAKPYIESGELIVLNNGATMEEPLALVWYPRPEMPAYFKAIVKAVK